MTAIVKEVFEARGIGIKDADASTGSKDYLDRILKLVRGTGFTVALFSTETRSTAMANIALELGFAAMCGKPIMIVKSHEAPAPSDLTRTDWIMYDPANETRFRQKLGQALDEIDHLVGYEEDLLTTALEGRATDCAIAFERANKAFLLSGEERFVEAAEKVIEKLKQVDADVAIGDLERLRSEIRTFVRQARRVIRRPA